MTFIMLEFVSGLLIYSKTFATESNALDATATRIVNRACKWDLSNNKLNYIANKFNNHIKNNKLDLLIKDYNTLSISDRYDVSYEIIPSILSKISPPPPKPIPGVDILRAGTFNKPAHMFSKPTPSYGTVKSTSIPTKTSTSIQFKANTPGAKCRGPSCQYESEYAYADKPDGTFVCHQCKFFGYE